MFNIKDHVSLEKLSGIVTWAIVAGMSLFIMIDNAFSVSQISLAIGLYFLYPVLWLALTREECYPKDSMFRRSILSILFFVVIAIYFTVPASFNAILMGILGGGLPHFLSVKRSLFVGTLAMLPLYLIYKYYWGNEYMFLTTSLFWAFNMFAIIMVNSTVNEKQAKEELEKTNRELISTQSLLQEAVKQNERIRIARNIHDLLGHHLTALSINLQVASLQSEGEVKQSVDQCYQLAKLLLSDVREAVSDIREKSHIDLKTAIENISKQVPQLNIDMNYEDETKIDDIQIADTLLKCVQESVTNSIKHSKGSKMSLSLKQDASHINLHIKSMGPMPEKLLPGNGISGMKERVALLKGSINFDLSNNIFSTDISIPMSNTPCL